MGKPLLNIFLFILFCMASITHAQTGAPDVFRYQAIARNSSGVEIPNQSVAVKVGIYSGSSTGILEWEETHSVTTDAKGLFLLNIGNGASTGTGALASFSLTNWKGNSHYVKIEIDFGSGYTDVGNAQLFSVPYAYYSTSSKSVQNISLNDLADADTSGIKTGTILKWNGTNWKPYKDDHSDTVSYAYNSGKAQTVDTAKYAIHVINPSVDTVSFAFQADSSGYSFKSGYVPVSTNSVNSDTAIYANFYLPYNWSILGNSPAPGKFLGTISSSNLVFKTSNVERMRLDTNGRWGVGTAAAITSSVYFSGNDGLLSRGGLNTGSLPDSSFNTRFMWYPGKAALRIGEINSDRWNSANVGYYSFAAGYNTEASGIYSIAMGYNSVALNENCVSIGRYCYTDITSVISNGGSIAMGDSCIVTSTRSIAMGYKNRSEGGIVMGYKNAVYWASQTSAWGTKNSCSGDCSISLGSNTNSNGMGTFVFSDTSAVKMTANIDFQFKVRASGGVVFYSDPSLTNGVELFPGAGAWSSVSDRNKKENFKNELPEDILKKITKIKISTWNYKSQKTVRHIGPTAQEFHSVFGIGENNKTICTIDMDGISMIGIKALEKRTSDLSEQFKKLDDVSSQVNSIDFNELNNRMNNIEKTLLLQNQNR